MNNRRFSKSDFAVNKPRKQPEDKGDIAVLSIPPVWMIKIGPLTWVNMAEIRSIHRHEHGRLKVSLTWSNGSVEQFAGQEALILLDEAEKARKMAIRRFKKQFPT